MLNLSALSTLFCCVLLCHVASDSPVDWASYLRDAITSSESKARAGQAHVFVTFESTEDGQSFTATLDGDIEWADDLLYQSYKISSPFYSPFGIEQPGSLRASPQFNLLISSKEVVLYNGLAKVIGIVAKADPGYTPLLHLHPRTTWYSCAPLSTKGRQWTGMLDYVTREKNGATSAITFTREENDIIHMQRVDPDGLELHLYFSLRAGGNIVRLETKPSARTKQHLRATFDWVRLSETFVLKSCQWESNNRGPQNNPYKYRIDYSAVKLGPQAPSQFTLNRVRNNVVGRTLVRDHIANRSHYIAGKAEPQEGMSDRLVGILLSRGFAQGKGDKSEHVHACYRFGVFGLHDQPAARSARPTVW